MHHSLGWEAPRSSSFCSLSCYFSLWGLWRMHCHRGWRVPTMCARCWFWAFSMQTPTQSCCRAKSWKFDRSMNELSFEIENLKANNFFSLGLEIIIHVLYVQFDVLCKAHATIIPDCKGTPYKLSVLPVRQKQICVHLHLGYCWPTNLNSVNLLQSMNFLSTSSSKSVHTATNVRTSPNRGHKL